MDQKSREELHEILVSILGSRNVYYQPPDSKQLSYPCIIYKRVKNDKVHANNDTYMLRTRYSVTLIDKSPISETDTKIMELKHCSLDTQFAKDNLNHYIYNLYF